MILAGTQSQHQKEDSLIDLNEESSYMKQSQPMPDQLHKQNPAMYMNQAENQDQTKAANLSYQRLPLQVSDHPTQNQSENQISHPR